MVIPFVNGTRESLPTWLRPVRSPAMHAPGLPFARPANPGHRPWTVGALVPFRSGVAAAPGDGIGAPVAGSAAAVARGGPAAGARDHLVNAAVRQAGVGPIAEKTRDLIVTGTVPDGCRTRPRST